MNSIYQRMPKDEEIIWSTKCHWAMLLGPIVVIILGGLAVRSHGVPAFVLIAFGLVWCVLSYITLDRTEIGLTEKRVLISTAFPLPRLYDIPLNDVVGIDFYQPALGSLMNFGKIWIVYRGRNRCLIRFVSSPALFVSKVRQCLSPADRS